MKSVRGDNVLSVLVQLGGIAPEGVISEPMENLLQPRVLISLLTIQLRIYI